MKVKLNPSKLIARKAVHPRAPYLHGFFGKRYLPQHMMADEHWTPSSLNEQFTMMTDLLTKRLIVEKLALKAREKAWCTERNYLKRQCRNGRDKLYALQNANRQHIRKKLKKHKDMQRQYEQMSPELVADHINQHTFTMRKEYDRLKYRIDQLQKDYKEKLLQKAELEDRIKYHNEFMIDEEAKISKLTTRIQNSKVRLWAGRKLNLTYKKMIQVLRQDSIFYGPILKSLNDDIEDQTKFISQILNIGMPGIVQFKELSEQYKAMDDKSRKKISSILHVVEHFKNGLEVIRSNIGKSVAATRDENYRKRLERYMHNTNSMHLLRIEEDTIADVIKQVKYATLCFRVQEIIPYIKYQNENNIKLQKVVHGDLLRNRDLETRVKYIKVMEDLVNEQHGRSEEKRHNKIEELKSAIEEEDESEAETMAHMNHQADIFVLLRFSLWKLNDIMHYVSYPLTIQKQSKPKSSYLKLPLLKFDMLTMYAVPPVGYDPNIGNIMQTVKNKLALLMRYYQKHSESVKLDDVINDYQEACSRVLRDSYPDIFGATDTTSDSEMLSDVRSLLPTRKSIKAAKIKFS